MNTVFRLLFTAVWFGAITPAQADVQGQAEASQTAAGQIDSSTVEVGPWIGKASGSRSQGHGLSWIRQQKRLQV